MVDDSDFAELSRHHWQAQVTSTGVYAKRNITAGCKQRVVFMHRQIMGLSNYERVPDPSTAVRGGSTRMKFVHNTAADGKVVDHKDGDTLNNRRGNLRVATRSVNGRNTWKHREAQLLQKIAVLESK